ncbi:hypothetical protein [Propionivibrio sp.]|uniref:hypothetical protein n=1 Tax=Propionivibrio sp. TaxID=2212460 RepID=UPI003BF06C4D
MRSTKASAAVERLRKRSGIALYSMSCRSDGLFSLHRMSTTGQSELVGSPLPMDEFVHFVNGLSPEKPRRVSKLDEAFRSQLNKK